MRVGEPDPDLAALPPGIRAAAHVFANGEVAWPNADAGHAIDALASAGKIITGLDARTLYPDGTLMEIPVSAWREIEGEARTSAIERARAEALDALPLARSEGTHVLMGWM